MPELPEVETIKLGLQPKIIGLQIIGAEILNPKSFLSDPSLVINKTVVGVIRRAKVLGVELSPSEEIASSRTPRNDDYTMLFHLKMSGQVICISDSRSTINDNRFVGGHPTKDMLSDLPNRSTRVIFSFSDGSTLFFNDQRKFGWIKLVKSEECEVKNFGMASEIGPEPLEQVLAGKY